MSSTQTVLHRVRVRRFGPQSTFRYACSKSILAAATALAVLGSVAAFGASPTRLAVVSATASADDGHIVTGTFRHHNAKVVDLYVEGEESPIGTTVNHRFWSEDRWEFVRADSLREGERLRGVGANL